MKEKKTVGPIVLMVFLLFSMLTLVIAQTARPPWDVPDTYRSKENPYRDDTSLKMIGLQNYNRHCKSCHGKLGQGDGVMAANLKTFPGDFTLQEFKEYTDGEIYYMSFIGRDEMPNFEKQVPDEEGRWALVNYIRSLGN